MPIERRLLVPHPLRQAKDIAMILQIMGASDLSKYGSKRWSSENLNSIRFLNGARQKDLRVESEASKRPTILHRRFAESTSSHGLSGTV